MKVAATQTTTRKSRNRRDRCSRHSLLSLPRRAALHVERRDRLAAERTASGSADATAAISAGGSDRIVGARGDSRLLMRRAPTPANRRTAAVSLETVLLGRLQLVQHQREGQVPLRRSWCTGSSRSGSRSSTRRPRQPVEALGQLDVWQLGQPDLHAPSSRSRSASRCRSAPSRTACVGELVVLRVVPAREVHGVAARDRLRRRSGRASGSRTARGSCRRGRKGAGELARREAVERSPAARRRWRRCRARFSISTTTGPTLVKSKKLMISSFTGWPFSSCHMP